MSSFSGLSTALSGLVAQRYGLDTTGQNVANANTPGYSRQRVVAEPVNPASGGTAVFSRWDGPGTGVEVVDVQRITDALVDNRVRAERSAAEHLSASQGVWNRVDVALNEPSDIGVQAQLSSFWSAWQDLSNDPGMTATRTQVLQTGASVADALGSVAAEVSEAWGDSRSELRALVSEVNATSSSVADLNSSIRKAAAGGESPNELMDRRDALVVRLSELTGGTVRRGELGTVDVFVGGSALVRGSSATPLALDPSSAGSLTDAQAGASTRLTGTGGGGVDVPGGRIGAVLTALNDTWVGVADHLDAFAVDLATKVNTVHASGKDLEGAAGGAFFSGSTAATLTVAVTDTARVAASGQPVGLDASGAPTKDLDGSLAQALGGIGRGAAAPDGVWRDFVAHVGAQTQAAQRRSDAQSVVVRDVTAAREAVSGVDIDEELTNMVMYQRAYEGAARMLTAVDQALDTLINRTGLVGR